MDHNELTKLTNQRISTLTLSELCEAVTALESDKRMETEILYSIRERNYEDLGKNLILWLSIYHQAEIDLHGGI